MLSCNGKRAYGTTFKSSVMVSSPEWLETLKTACTTNSTSLHYHIYATRHNTHAFKLVICTVYGYAIPTYIKEEEETPILCHVLLNAFQSGLNGRSSDVGQLINLGESTEMTLVNILRSYTFFSSSKKKYT